MITHRVQSDFPDFALQFSKIFSVLVNIATLLNNNYETSFFVCFASVSIYRPVQTYIIYLTRLAELASLVKRKKTKIIILQLLVTIYYATTISYAKNFYPNASFGMGK